MDGRTWTWRSLMWVCLTCSLALDSNTIRSSKEMQPLRSRGNPVDRGVRRRMEATLNSHHTVACSTPYCSTPPRSGCSNRAQRRLSSQNGHVDSDWSHDVGGTNRTKAPEMSVCVRSGDCASGLCCVRYLMGKRCQRVPVEGEVCLLRGSKKLRRNLGRCDCGAGLSCSAAGQMELSRVKGQGVCTPRRRQGQRKTRHSGKKRRTAERSC